MNRFMISVPGNSMFHRHLLIELDRRRKINPTWSLRAFARFLQVPPTTLKFLLDGVRKPNRQTLDQIAIRCEWSKSLIAEMREELAASRKSARRSGRSSYVSAEEPEVLADIVYFALSRLAQLPNQSASILSLSKKLGISEAKIKGALETLVQNKYVSVQGGKLNKGDKLLYFAENPPGEKSRHLQMQYLDRIREFTDRGPFEKGRTVMGFVGISEAELPLLSKKLFGYLNPLRKDFPGSEDSELYCVMLSVVPFTTRSNSRVRGSK